ncbi:MAG: FIST N-terminal domain-containing protein [Actinomycetota bacterium]
MAEPVFSVGVSTRDDPERAAEEAARAARAGLGDLAATLTLVFATPDLATHGEEFLGPVHAALAPEVLLGATGEAVIGGGREFEEGPAVAVWAAHLPGADILPFRLAARIHGDRVTVAGWPAELSAPDGPGAPLLLLADPFTFPADAVLGEVNSKPEGAWVVGGLASGGGGPGEHRLFHQGDVLHEGAVGALLRGVAVTPVVSQGCEPIGPEMVITSATGQVVEELAGMPALDKLRTVLTDLDEHERELASRGLLAGLVINENQPDYGRGDFLVRGIQGGDSDTGALVVGERVRVGQTMRFHVRDAASADDDLRHALRRARAGLAPERPRGGLVFSCNGRGTHMFPGPDHDATAIADELSAVPTAGIFCNGEIGPVGGKSFLHGFTATMAVFSGG